MTWKTSTVLLRGWAAGFFSLLFVQYFLISTFMFQSCVFICTQYQTALLILYCQWKIGFTCGSVNTEFSQEATTKKPTLSKFLNHAAMRGAGCLLGPFYQGLPSLGFRVCPVFLSWQAGQVWQQMGSCSAPREGSAEEPEASSEAVSHLFWWVDLSSCTVLRLCRFPNNIVSRTQQTVILSAHTSWQWLL